MMPWEHLLVAAVPVVSYTLLRDGRVPGGAVVLAVVVGSQFPDLVDKPLAWQFGVLPNGRMFMHSLVVAAPFSLAVLALSWRLDRRRVGGAFVAGHLLHVPGDFYATLPGWPPPLPNNMLWPLVPPRDLTKPEFVGEYSLLSVSTSDILMIGAGAALFGYAVLAVTFPDHVARLLASVLPDR